MKMLIVPVLTNSRASRCSTWYMLRTVAQQFLDAGPNRFVYAAVPSADSPFVMDDPVIDPRWKEVPVKFTTRSRYQTMLFPPESFETFTNWGEHWDWDVLWTTMNNSEFWRFFTRSRGTVDSCSGKLLLLMDCFPLLSFKPTVTWDPQRDIFFLASYLNFDHIVVQAEHERVSMLTTARRWLTPGAYVQFERKLSVRYIQPTIDLGIALRRPPPVSTGKLRVVYTQKWDENRRPEHVLMVLRNAFALSDDVEIIVTTNSSKGMPSEDTSFISGFSRSGREQYYELLKSCDVSVAWAREEGVAYSLVEAAASGVIPIAKREPWSVDFYGKDYWGLVSGEAEAVSKIQWIARHRQERFRYFQQWYTTTFKPKIERNGALGPLQEEFIAAHLRRMAQRIRSGEHVSDAVDRSPLSEVHLNDPAMLATIEGIRIHPRGDIVTWAPLQRRRDLLMDRLRLIEKGWLDTIEPGVMVRAGSEDRDGRRTDDGSGTSACGDSSTGDQPSL